MWPVHCAYNPPMLDRVVMEIVHMARQIDIVPDQVLPIATLPNSSFTLGLPGAMNGFALCHPPRNPRLDQRPAQRVICTPGGQPPYRMQMFGQYDHCEQRKGMA